ncbi:putative ubiquitin-like-specific protease 2B protein [Corchorus olitorius]|uniref:Ubiquitin-like-specific protease 2B protein n=1 Tax=Corchorus olitorius TaxID=93759 RepID=A0A1R3HD34_9ROSI|nr:putative ubiquitin-like-specific protease 2B protein [Corchorus olitorius]
MVGAFFTNPLIRVFHAESSKDHRVPNNDQNNGHHIGSFRPHEAKTDGRLFKDVVVGDHNPPVSKKQLSCAEVGKSPNVVECDLNIEKTTSKGGPLKEVSLDFTLPQDDMNRLKRSSVARLRNTVYYKIIEDSVIRQGVHVNITPFCDLDLLLIIFFFFFFFFFF